MICGGENGTSGCHLAVFSVDIALAYDCVALYPPLTLLPYRNASGSDVNHVAIYINFSPKN